MATLRYIGSEISTVVVNSTLTTEICDRPDTIIKLINSGKIYRFAMQPLSPNLFRLAVHAAMREHHRRLADPRVVRMRMQRDAKDVQNDEMYASFVQHLRRFTEVS